MDPEMERRARLARAKEIDDLGRFRPYDASDVTAARPILTQNPSARPWWRRLLERFRKGVQ